MKLMLWKFSAVKVFVYRNLHKECWSVRALTGDQKGRVILHAKSVDLSNAFFKVSENGRQRVIRQKAKEVHAGVVGWLDSAHVMEERYDSQAADTFDTECTGWGTWNASGTTWQAVTYNPYKYSSFVYTDGFGPVVGDKFQVILDDDMTVRAMALSAPVAA